MPPTDFSFADHSAINQPHLRERAISFINGIASILPFLRI
jgi:hypothetical protein